MWHLFLNDMNELMNLIYYTVSLIKSKNYRFAA